jgi:ribosomal protein L32
LQLHCGLGVDSVSNRSEHLEPSWAKARQKRTVYSLTAICEVITYKMWEPRLLTSLGTSMGFNNGRITELTESSLSARHITKCNSSGSEKLYQSMCGQNYCNKQTKTNSVALSPRANYTD